MSYNIKNLTYSPLRILAGGKEYHIPGRDADKENFVIVESIDDDIRNLAIKGLIKVKQVK
jgi:hypothetical protein